MNQKYQEEKSITFPPFPCKKNKSVQSFPEPPILNAFNFLRRNEFNLTLLQTKILPPEFLAIHVILEKEIFIAMSSGCRGIIDNEEVAEGGESANPVWEVVILGCVY